MSMSSEQTSLQSVRTWLTTQLRLLVGSHNEIKKEKAQELFWLLQGDELPSSEIQKIIEAMEWESLSVTDLVAAIVEQFADYVGHDARRYAAVTQQIRAAVIHEKLAGAQVAFDEHAKEMMKQEDIKAADFVFDETQAKKLLPKGLEKPKDILWKAWSNIEKKLHGEKGKDYTELKEFFASTKWSKIDANDNNALQLPNINKSTYHDLTDWSSFGTYYYVHWGILESVKIELTGLNGPANVLEWLKKGMPSRGFGITQELFDGIAHKLLVTSYQNIKNMDVRRDRDRCLRYLESAYTAVNSLFEPELKKVHAKSLAQAISEIHCKDEVRDFIYMKWGRKFDTQNSDNSYNQPKWMKLQWIKTTSFESDALWINELLKQEYEQYATKLAVQEITKKITAGNKTMHDFENLSKNELKIKALELYASDFSSLEAMIRIVWKYLSAAIVKEFNEKIEVIKVNIVVLLNRKDTKNVRYREMRQWWENDILASDLVSGYDGKEKTIVQIYAKLENKYHIKKENLIAMLKPLVTDQAKQTLQQVDVLMTIIRSDITLYESAVANKDNEEVARLFDTITKNIWDARVLLQKKSAYAHTQSIQDIEYSTQANVLIERLTEEMKVLIEVQNTVFKDKVYVIDQNGRVKMETVWAYEQGQGIAWRKKVFESSLPKFWWEKQEYPIREVIVSWYAWSTAELLNLTAPLETAKQPLWTLIQAWENRINELNTLQVKIKKMYHAHDTTDEHYHHMLEDIQLLRNQCLADVATVLINAILAEKFEKYGDDTCEKSPNEQITLITTIYLPHVEKVLWRYGNSTSSPLTEIKQKLTNQLVWMRKQQAQFVTLNQNRAWFKSFDGRLAEDSLFPIDEDKREISDPEDAYEVITAYKTSYAELSVWLATINFAPTNSVVQQENVDLLQTARNMLDALGNYIDVLNEETRALLAEEEKWWEEISEALSAKQELEIWLLYTEFDQKKSELLAREKENIVAEKRTTLEQQRKQFPVKESAEYIQLLLQIDDSQKLYTYTLSQLKQLIDDKKISLKQMSTQIDVNVQDYINRLQQYEELMQGDEPSYEIEDLIEVFLVWRRVQTMDIEQAKELLVARWKQEHQGILEEQESGKQDRKKLADEQAVVWFGNYWAHELKTAQMQKEISVHMADIRACVTKHNVLWQKFIRNLESFSREIYLGQFPTVMLEGKQIDTHFAINQNMSQYMQDIWRRLHTQLEKDQSMNPQEKEEFIDFYKTNVLPELEATERRIKDIREKIAALENGVNDRTVEQYVEHLWGNSEDKGVQYMIALLKAVEELRGKHEEKWEHWLNTYELQTDRAWQQKSLEEMLGRLVQIYLPVERRDDEIYIDAWKRLMMDELTKKIKNKAFQHRTIDARDGQDQQDLVDVVDTALDKLLVLYRLFPETPLIEQMEFQWFGKYNAAKRLVKIESDWVEFTKDFAERMAALGAWKESSFDLAASNDKIDTRNTEKEKWKTENKKLNKLLETPYSKQNLIDAVVLIEQLFPEDCAAIARWGTNIQELKEFSISTILSKRVDRIKTTLGVDKMFERAIKKIDENIQAEQDLQKKEADSKSTEMINIYVRDILPLLDEMRAIFPKKELADVGMNAFRDMYVYGSKDQKVEFMKRLEDKFIRKVNDAIANYKNDPLYKAYVEQILPAIELLKKTVVQAAEEKAADKKKVD